MLQNYFSLRQFRLTKWSFTYIHVVLRVWRLTYTRGLIRFSNWAGFPELLVSMSRKCHNHTAHNPWPREEETQNRKSLMTSTAQTEQPAQSLPSPARWLQNQKWHLVNLFILIGFTRYMYVDKISIMELSILYIMGS